MVHIKNSEEIERMRATCKLAGQVLEMIAPHVQPGVSTDRLNSLCHEYICDHGAIPSPLNYYGFPKSICTSVNEVVCHGIPGKQVLREGDIVNVDITTKLDGYHGDTSRTFRVGEVSERSDKIARVAHEALVRGIAAVKPGATLGDIGHAVQSYAESEGCSVVREYCGHGIGREFHEEPQVLHYGKPGRGFRLRPGMTFTIEPMINLGKPDIRLLKDNWTVVTRDGSLSGQYEHTLLITDHGCEILTSLDGTV
ncbi:MAG: type I methionyl aminopeptidase [Nitrospirota bacterium]|nr:type I methionyl aminopeptidase [Nitrospirota bacterium]